MHLNEICGGEPTVGRNLDITANPAWLLELLAVLGVAADPSVQRTGRGAFITPSKVDDY